MKEAGEPPHSSTTSVPAALLDYFEAPGKYQLTLRQPAVLFASVREILQLASDRAAADAPQSSRLREAAHFFIRAALLYPGGDHYAVLGLAPGESATDLKERYRLLMRLIHPDFAGSGAAWPADAAVRVNRAYEVLSSPVLRRDYDEQMAAARSPRAGSAKMPAFRAPAVRRNEKPQRLGRKAAVLFGLAVGIPAVLLLLPRAEPDHLVQRFPAPTRAPERAPEHPAPATPVPETHPVATLPATAETQALPSASRLPEATVAAAPAEPAHLAAPAVPPPAAPAMRVAQPPPRPAPPPAPMPPPAIRDQAVAASSPAMSVPLAALPVADTVRPQEAVAAPPLATPAPGSVPPSAPAVMLTAASPPPIPAPTLAEAQPLLTQLLQMLESGSGEQLLRLLDGEARKRPAAQALSRQYEQLVKDGRPVRLSQVEFNGEPRDGGVLLVTGRIRLHAGEPTIGSFGQKLVVRAEFAQRAGRVQLTGLSGASE